MERVRSVNELHRSGDFLDCLQVVRSVFQKFQDTVCVLAFSLALYGAFAEFLKGAFDGGSAFFRILPFAGFADIVPVVLAGA